MNDLIRKQLLEELGKVPVGSSPSHELLYEKCVANHNYDVSPEEFSSYLMNTMQEIVGGDENSVPRGQSQPSTRVRTKSASRRPKRHGSNASGTSYRGSTNELSNHTFNPLLDGKRNLLLSLRKATGGPDMTANWIDVRRHYKKNTGRHLNVTELNKIAGVEGKTKHELFANELSGMLEPVEEHGYVVRLSYMSPTTATSLSPPSRSTLSPSSSMDESMVQAPLAPLNLSNINDSRHMHNSTVSSEGESVVSGNRFFEISKDGRDDSVDEQEMNQRRAEIVENLRLMGVDVRAHSSPIGNKKLTSMDIEELDKANISDIVNEGEEMNEHKPILNLYSLGSDSGLERDDSPLHTLVHLPSSSIGPSGDMPSHSPSHILTPPTIVVDEVEELTPLSDSDLEAMAASGKDYEVMYQHRVSGSMTTNEEEKEIHPTYAEVAAPPTYAEVVGDHCEDIIREETVGTVVERVDDQVAGATTYATVAARCASPTAEDAVMKEKKEKEHEKTPKKKSRKAKEMCGFAVVYGEDVTVSTMDDEKKEENNKDELNEEDAQRLECEIRLLSEETARNKEQVDTLKRRLTAEIEAREMELARQQYARLEVEEKLRVEREEKEKKKRMEMPLIVSKSSPTRSEADNVDDPEIPPIEEGKLDDEDEISDDGERVQTDGQMRQKLEYDSVMETATSTDTMVTVVEKKRMFTLDSVAIDLPFIDSPQSTGSSQSSTSSIKFRMGIPLKKRSPTWEKALDSTHKSPLDSGTRLVRETEDFLQEVDNVEKAAEEKQRLESECSDGGMHTLSRDSEIVPMDLVLDDGVVIPDLDNSRRATKDRKKREKEEELQIRRAHPRRRNIFNCCAVL